MSHKTLFVDMLVGTLAFLAQPGAAAEQLPAHEGARPSQSGVHRQPTGDEKGISPDQAHEIDRLYDQLLSTGAKTQPHRKRPR